MTPHVSVFFVRCLKGGMMALPTLVGLRRRKRFAVCHHGDGQSAGGGSCRFCELGRFGKKIVKKGLDKI